MFDVVEAGRRLPAAPLGLGRVDHDGLGKARKVTQALVERLHRGTAQRRGGELLRHRRRHLLGIRGVAAHSCHGRQEVVIVVTHGGDVDADRKGLDLVSDGVLMSGGPENQRSRASEVRRGEGLGACMLEYSRGENFDGEVGVAGYLSLAYRAGLAESQHPPHQSCQRDTPANNGRAFSSCTKVVFSRQQGPHASGAECFVIDTL
jgi:hypothetical protein